jgi:hypothetical protein
MKRNVLPLEDFQDSYVGHTTGESPAESQTDLRRTRRKA